MSTCVNCAQSLDMRKSTRCEACDSPLHKECAINDGGVFCDVCFMSGENTKEEKQDYEIPSVIRRSYIETYRKCAYQFYLQVIKGHDAPPTIYTQLGIDLHTLFESAIIGYGFTSDMMKEKMKELFDAYPEEYFDFDFKSANREDMWERCVSSIDAFYEILPTIEKVFRTEERISFDVGEDLPQASIAMDLITENDDGTLSMHDWKTGRIMVGQKLSSDLQAPLYIKAVRDKYQRPVRDFTFYYLQEGKTRTFTRVDDENYVCIVNKRKYYINLTDAIREVQHIFSQIKNGNFNIPRDTKSMHYTCKVCHLKKQGLCEGAYEQSWHNANSHGFGW